LATVRHRRANKAPQPANTACGTERDAHGVGPFAADDPAVEHPHNGGAASPSSASVAGSCIGGGDIHGTRTIGEEGVFNLAESSTPCLAASAPPLADGRELNGELQSLGGADVEPAHICHGLACGPAPPTVIAPHSRRTREPRFVEAASSIGTATPTGSAPKDNFHVFAAHLDVVEAQVRAAANTARGTFR
jgi:hypothetical protein